MPDLRLAPVSEVGSSVFHRRLKQAVQPFHDRLEAALPLLDPALTLEQYQALLTRFYGFYAPLEAAMGQFACDLQGEIAPRRKARWLKEDLLALGLRDETIAALPQCRDLPPLTTASRLLGSLYVVEGATLGGQMVVRVLQHSLGSKAQTCDRFFRSYGPRVHPLWNEFLGMLIAAAEKPGWEPEIIESACATFAGFERWLCQESHQTQTRKL